MAILAETETINTHLRASAQAALRCFASTLESEDIGHAKRLGWTAQKLRRLVDNMYPAEEPGEEV